MKFVTFVGPDGQRVGVLRQQRIYDLIQMDRAFPADMLSVCSLSVADLRRIEQSLSAAPSRPVDEVQILAPFPRPAKNIFCVGKNYHAHALEFHQSGFDASSKEALPDAPIIFTKAVTSVIGPGQAIESSLDATGSVDYEGELAVVIGKPGRGIRKQDAFDHVFGYTIVNDVTSRVTQSKHKQWFLGKGLDTFCPMGPSLVTKEELGDVGALQLTTMVNDEVRQSASVSALIFDIPTLIETISRSLTLETGDIIATGTPEGVGIGFNPPKFLRPGDKVAVSINGIGTLANPVA